MVSEDQYVRRLTTFSVMPALQIPLGIWMLASPYFLQYSIYGDARVIAGMVGPFIVGFAITRLAVTPPWRWVGWVNAVLGAVLVLTPFFLGLTHATALTINFILVGALVIITSVLGQLEKEEIGDHPVART